MNRWTMLTGLLVAASISTVAACSGEPVSAENSGAKRSAGRDAASADKARSGAPNFGQFVRFTLKEGAGPGFDALMEKTTAGVRAKEPRTVVYICHKVDGKPNERIFYELYQNRAALAQHERQPHTKHFLAKRNKYVAKTVVDRMTPYTGKFPTQASR